MATLRQRKRRNALRRVARIGMSTAGAVLKSAASFIVDDQSQREAFAKLMPYLCALRNKGCSWSKLAVLLNGCGFDLHQASVRTYYSEMFAEGK